MKKMTFGVALLSTLILSQGQAFAKKAKSKATLNYKKFSKTVVNESIANREGKNISFNAAILGAAYNTMSTSVEVGYHINLDTLVTLQLSSLKNYNQHSEDTTKEEQEVWERNGLGTVLSAGMKKFVSNSFYIKPEIYIRNQERVNSTISTSSGFFEEMELTEVDKGKYRDLGLSFKIGNQWQWDNFTLGCDWFGVSRSATILEQTGNVDQEDLHAVSLLNFYMGASF